ncbi:hypothetical protein C1H46_026740 [Malus baccata]|uniref:Uncharacterized protein n=1 Tax=Malus baccata TaxID=106549 RepID=A0A540LMM7_MALBA|nr:hypothetical protein C1H46_026740 [Malus baccata]
MKAFKVSLVLSMVMALVITLSATTDQEESFLDEENKDTDDATKSMQSDKTTSLRSDKKNCGSCNNKCEKSSSCVYGMCNYA